MMVDKNLIADRIRELFNRTFSGQEYVLVDVNVSQARNMANINLLVDLKAGGITINECASINRGLRELIESSGLLPGSGYALEVSSPGIDRPLSSEDDFKRNINRRMVLYLKDAFRGKLEIEGVLSCVSGGNLILAVAQEELVLPVSLVRKGRQLI